MKHDIALVDIFFFKSDLFTLQALEEDGIGFFIGSLLVVNNIQSVVRSSAAVVDKEFKSFIQGFKHGLQILDVLVGDLG